MVLGKSQGTHLQIIQCEFSGPKQGTARRSFPGKLLCLVKIYKRLWEQNSAIYSRQLLTDVRLISVLLHQFMNWFKKINTNQEIPWPKIFLLPFSH